MFYIIFVEPESSGNIGSVARVMKNFGFYDLILVNPVEVDDDAYKFAVHAEDVLKSARIVESPSKNMFKHSQCVVPSIIPLFH